MFISIRSFPKKAVSFFPEKTVVFGRMDRLACKWNIHTTWLNIQKMSKNACPLNQLLSKRIFFLFALSFFCFQKAMTPNKHSMCLRLKVEKKLILWSSFQQFGLFSSILKKKLRTRDVNNCCFFSWPDSTFYRAFWHELYTHSWL